MGIEKMTNDEDLWNEIPSAAWVSLARRGMGKISLDQCFLIGCDNQDYNLLEPFKKEEYEEPNKQIKIIHIKCQKCGGVFQLKLETIMRVAKPTKLDPNKSEDDQVLSMGVVYALDEDGKNLGQIGWF